MNYDISSFDALKDVYKSDEYVPTARGVFTLRKEVYEGAPDLIDAKRADYLNRAGLDKRTRDLTTSVGDSFEFDRKTMQTVPRRTLYITHLLAPQTLG